MEVPQDGLHLGFDVKNEVLEVVLGYLRLFHLRDPSIDTLL